MDPSYDNGSGSNAGQAGSSGGIFSRSDNTSAGVTPGVKPGVIASGPDPADVPSTPNATVAPKDPPAIEIASETTPGLSLGSRHLFKKPRVGAPKRNMIASGGDSSNIVTPSVSSSRASGGGSRGPKKGLIIGGILIVLLVVGLIVGLMVMNGGKKGSGGNTSVSNDQKDFLIYANYLLYDVNGANNDIGSFDENKDYAVTTAYINNDKDFFNEAQELWKVFYGKYITDDNKTDATEIIGDVEYQNQLMDFAVKYMNTSELDEDMLLKLYLKDGLDNAKNDVDKYYEDLLSTIFEPGKEYATMLINHAKSALNLYSMYSSYGCIKNNEVDNTCVKKNSVAMATAETEYAAEGMDIDYKFIGRTVSELEEICFRINDDFRSENEK